MIDGINQNYYVQCGPQTNRISNPLNQNNVSNPIPNHVMKGLETLGVYNMSLVKNNEEFEHTPADFILPPNTNINDINGEKIYNNKGELEYIVNNDGKYETKYFVSEEDPKKIGEIEVKDNYTGKLLKTQRNRIPSNWIELTEYPKNEPNVEYRTSYANGKVEFIAKDVTLPNGKIKSFEKDLSTINPQYRVSIHDKNYKNHIYVDIDSNKEVKNIHIGKEIKNVDYATNIRLNKGAIIGIDEYKDTVIPNYMERDVFNDTDVLPTVKFDKDEIERLAKNNPNKNYSFYGNGSLKEINEGNLKVEFNEDGSQKIVEYYNDGSAKITEYFKDGSTSVIYEKGNIKKHLFISDNNQPTDYCIEQDGKTLRSASFTDDGYLCWCAN